MRYLDSLLSSGETVQLAVHQHWVTLLRSFVLNGALIALLVLVAGLGSGAATAPGAAADIAGPFLLVALAAVVVPIALLARDIARWSARQYVVTTRRVIEIEGLFNRRVSDSNLDKVNDLVMRQSVIGRLLGYGDVEIITGSDIGLNRLERISQPLRFQKALLENKEDLDTLSRVGEGVSAGPADVTGAIERLASLRDRGLISAEEFEHKKSELLARM